MTKSSDKAEGRELQRADEIVRLHQIEAGLAQVGLKLGPRDRLKAAFHLTRAWNTANKAGLRQQDFEDLVFERLKRPHGNRSGFTLKNWKLKRGEDPFKQDLTTAYTGKPAPQKALDTYLTVIEVAAEYCDADPDSWKLAMMRDLSIWSRASWRPGVAPQDDRPAETLAILLNALCDKLAQQNRLGDTFDAVNSMSCRWEMFQERLVPVTDGTNCMEQMHSPLIPGYGEGTYFEEMFPFPSVPLLHVPYLVGDTSFALAPESPLRQQEAERAASGGADTVRAGVPADAPGLEVAAGKLVWLRELRLCVVINAQGGFSPAIETRPRVEVALLEDDRPYSGRHHVIGGYDPRLQYSLFYARSENGGIVWPHISDHEGVVWRIQMALDPVDQDLPEGFSERDPETTGWAFDADPIRDPGEVIYEPHYLSYTPATAPYLRHWLTDGWRLGAEWGRCPWSRSHFDAADPASPWNRTLPPIHELNFPDSTPATWIESCLHNGLIEGALQAAIDRLADQTAALQAEWHHARERHSNALLKRWKTEERKQDS